MGYWNCGDDSRRIARLPTEVGESTAWRVRRSKERNRQVVTVDRAIPARAGYLVRAFQRDDEYDVPRRDGSTYRPAQDLHRCCRFCPMAHG